VESVLGPFGRLACRIISCPLDVRATPQQLSEVLTKVRARNVITLGGDYDTAGRLVLSNGVDVQHVPHLDELRVPLRSKFVSATIDADLARTVKTRSLGGAPSKDIQIGSISCVASYADGVYSLHAVRDAYQQQASQKAATDVLWGSPNVTDVIAAFARRGVQAIEPIEGAGEPGELVLRVTGDGGATAFVTLARSHTSIVSNSDALQQLLMSAVITDCLHSFA